MIPSDELRLEEFTERHDDSGLASAIVTVRADDGRTFTAVAGRVDDGIGLTRFADSEADAFVRDAFGALWYCIEEFHTRNIKPDLGPLAPTSQWARDAVPAWSEGDLANEFAKVVEDDADSTEQDTDTDTPADADTEAPQPEPAVSDGGAVPATEHAPDTLGPAHSPETRSGDDVEVGDDISDLVEEDEDDAEDEADQGTVDACPNCDGTTIYARETKPVTERWRCSSCESTFAEPLVREKKTTVASGDTDDDDDVELPDERPEWLAGSPEEIVTQSKTYLPLDAVIEAVVQEDDVPNVSRRLGRSTSDVRATVLQPLGLIDADGALLDDETLDERLTVISRWDDGQ